MPKTGRPKFTWMFVPTAIAALLSGAVAMAQEAGFDRPAAPAQSALVGIGIDCDEGESAALLVGFTAATDFAVFSRDEEIVLSLPQVSQAIPALPDTSACQMLEGVHFRPNMSAIGGQLKISTTAKTMISIEPVVAAEPAAWSLRIRLSPPSAMAEAMQTDSTAVQVKRVRIGEHDGVTRLVLDLSAPLEFELGRVGTALTVDLGPVEWQAAVRRQWSGGRLLAYRFEGDRLVIEGTRSLAWHRGFLLPPDGRRGDRLVLDTADR